MLGLAIAVVTVLAAGVICFWWLLLVPMKDDDYAGWLLRLGVLGVPVFGNWAVSARADKMFPGGATLVTEIVAISFIFTAAAMLALRALRAYRADPAPRRTHVH